jgi:hypothetical protein
MDPDDSFDYTLNDITRCRVVISHVMYVFRLLRHIIGSDRGTRV